MKKVLFLLLLIVAGIYFYQREAQKVAILLQPEAVNGELDNKPPAEPSFDQKISDAKAAEDVAALTAMVPQMDAFYARNVLNWALDKEKIDITLLSSLVDKLEFGQITRNDFSRVLNHTADFGLLTKCLAQMDQANFYFAFKEVLYHKPINIPLISAMADRLENFAVTEIDLQHLLRYSSDLTLFRKMITKSSNNNIFALSSTPSIASQHFEIWLLFLDMLDLQELGEHQRIQLLQSFDNAKKKEIKQALIIRFLRDHNCLDFQESQILLEFAATSNNLKLLRALRAKVHTMDADKRKNTQHIISDALYITAENGWLEGVKELAPCIVDERVINSAKEIAEKNRHLDIAFYLEADLKQHFDKRKRITNFREPISANNLKYYLDDLGLNQDITSSATTGTPDNAPNDNDQLQQDPGDQPIHLAARAGNVEKLKELIANGADVNLPNNDGDTPLHLAVMTHKNAAVAYLLEHGAKPHARNKSELTPWNLALLRGNSAIIDMLSNKMTKAKQ